MDDRDRNIPEQLPMVNPSLFEGIRDFLSREKEKASVVGGRLKEMIPPLDPIPDTFMRGDPIGIDPLVGLAKHAILDTPTKAYNLTRGAMEGTIDPRSDEGIKQALELTADLTGQGLLRSAVGPASAKPTFGVFAGPRSKTAPRDNLIDAFKMKERGASPTDIWHERGWWELPDKRWAYEIPDDLARFRKEWPGPTDSTYLRHRIEHPELLRAYPEMENLVTVADQLPGEGSSRFRGIDQYGPVIGGNRIRIPKEAMNDPDFPPLSNALGQPRKPTDLPLSVTLHELQHQIQGIEGWPRGSSPTKVAMDLIRASGAGQGSERAREAMEAFNKLPVEQKQALMHRLYERDYGEAMARATQYREPLNHTERRGRPPWLDFDVEPIIPFNHKFLGER